MAINPNLLIAAPMMQDVFVDDATGLPMSGGTITMYQDNSRSILKNWYYQSGIPGAYTYVPLDNPLTLSAAGTIIDPNGNDTIPFYYPYSETDNVTAQPYYIQVKNSNGQQQFVRQNFPFNVIQPTVTSVPTLNNLIINSAFYHNIGSATYTGNVNALIAPSAWDGFIPSGFDNIRYQKNGGTSTDTVSFIDFATATVGTLASGDITPQFYFNAQCTAFSSAGTQKQISFPLNVRQETLQNQPAVFTFQAYNVNLATSGTLVIQVVQYNGTGASPLSTAISVSTVNTTAGWQKFTVPFIFPSKSTTLSTTNDDFFSIQIQYPLSSLFNINIAVPQLYLGSTVPNNFFLTYDQLDPYIAGPRTGDVRVSLNGFAPYGWVLMNDGTIGNATSRTGQTQARWNIDTWQLFYTLWTTFQSQQSYAPMVNSTGGSVSYGATPYDDWVANNAITLPKTLGRALCSQGLASSGGVTTWALGQTTGTETVVLTSAQLASHTHGAPEGNFVLSGVAGSFSLGGPGTVTTDSSTASAGNNEAHNNMQPSIFYNVYMKL